VKSVIKWIAAALVVTWMALPCAAEVSTNVPLDHWSYAAIDKLADSGLIDGAMLATRPITRLEMAGYIAQATATLNRMPDAPEILGSIIDRLRAEFRDELIQIGTIDGWHAGSFIKPIEDPYARYVYGTEKPNIENMHGEAFDAHSNLRAGVASRGMWDDTVAFYVRPEYGLGSADWDQHIVLIEGYGKGMAGPLEVEAGRDSLWWGPARRGSMLMSNNAQTFPMIKLSNPQPIQLPWIFSWLGPFKAEWFMAELEENRDFSNAKLSGMRISAKPHPLIELGASRVMMFGGSGQPHVSPFDYAKMVLTTWERGENNQLAGVDASVRVPLEDSRLPRSVKFYVDAAGEDTAGGLPTKWGEILGLQVSDLFRNGRTDLRVEFADDHVQSYPGVFYTHSTYTSGYTYKGRVLGHYMGTESRDFSILLSHYLTKDLVADIGVDRVTHVLAPSGGADVFRSGWTWFVTSDWQIGGEYRYENGNGRDYPDDHVLQLSVIRHF
jgi:hypothetical protein